MVLEFPLACCSRAWRCRAASFGWPVLKFLLSIDDLVWFCACVKFWITRPLICCTPICNQRKLTSNEAGRGVVKLIPIKLRHVIPNKSLEIFLVWVPIFLSSQPGSSDRRVTPEMDYFWRISTLVCHWHSTDAKPGKLQSILHILSSLSPEYIKSFLWFE